MVASRLPTAFTEREYLALEAVAEVRHEFVDGQIIGMAGAELDHNQICQNVRLALGAALAGRPCRIVGADQRVKVESSSEYFYPDVIVVCGEPQLLDPSPRSLVNPNVIVEVLSPSTERYDRGEKWAAYQTIPTLTDYVLIGTDRRRVEQHQRGDGDSWTMRVLSLTAPLVLKDGTSVELGDLYRLTSTG
jgi:Uma2 family endonuclease